MKSILLVGLCFTLSLVLVFGSVNSSSFTLPKTAFASDDADHTTGDSGGGDNSNHGDDNQGGDTGDQDDDHSDGSHGMPPPEDAPAPTDTITAGGGGSDDDDGSDDDNNDNDNDNDNDNPQIPKDAPPTSDALTAKKLECPPGQEVTLFSTTCEPAGQDGTQSSTSAATVCPTSPTPTSYGISNGLLVTNAVWGPNNNNDFEIKTKQQNTPETVLLHRTATPINPGLKAEHALQDPAMRAVCTGKPVTVANPDGTMITYDKNGKISSVSKDDPVSGRLNVYDYDSDGRLLASSLSTLDFSTENRYDSQSGNLKEIDNRDWRTGLKTITKFDANGKPTSQTKQHMVLPRSVQTIQFDKDGKPLSTEITDMRGKPLDSSLAPRAWNE
jgi:hypothetical protein